MAADGGVLKALLKWTGLVLGGMALLLVVTLLLAALLVTLPPGERYLAGVAEDRLGSYLGRQVRLERLKTNLVSRIELEGLRIYQPGTEGADTLLRIGRLRVDYSLRPLLGRVVQLDRVVLEAPRVILVRDSTGFINLPEALQGGGEKEVADTLPERGWQVRLGELRVEGGRVSYLDRALKLEAQLHGLAVRADRIGDAEAEVARADYDFRLELADSSPVIYDQRQFTLARLTAAGAYRSGKELAVERLALTAERLSAEGWATLGLGAAPRALSGAIRLSGPLDPLLADFSALVPAELQPLSAGLDLQLGLAGTLEEPRFEFALALPQLLVKGIEVRQARFSGSFQPPRLMLDSLTLVLLNGRIEGAGSLTLGDTLTHQIRLRVEGLGLRPLLSALDQPQVELSGQLSLDLSSAGPWQSLDRLSATADFRATGLRYQGKPLPSLRGAVRLEQGQLAADLRQGGTMVQASLRQAGAGWRGAYRAELCSLDTYAAALGVAGLSGELQASGELAFGGEEGVAATAEFLSRRLAYRNFPVDTLAGSLAFRDGELTFGRTYVAGQIATIDPQAPPFDVDSLRGGFSYQVLLEGPLPRPDGTVLVGLDNLAYKHFALQDGELRLNFAGGLFRLERLRLRSYEVAAVLEGAFSPADSSGAFLLQFVRGEQAEPDSSLEIPTRDQVLWQPPAEPGEGQLLLNVALRREGGYELTALGHELGLIELTDFADLGRELAGRLDLRASFTGTPQRPELELALGIEELGYQGTELDSLGARARLEGGRLVLDTLLLVQGDHRLGASAWVEAGPEGPLAFGAESPTGGAVIAPALNLELAELALSRGQELEGAVGLDLRWRGKLGRPRVEGLVRVVEGAFHSGGGQEGGLGNLERINARLAFQDTVLRIDSLAWRVGDTPFALAGRIGLPGLGGYLADLRLYLADSLLARVEGSLSGAALDLAVKLDTVRLGVFQGMVPQLQRLTGTISADLTVAGSPSSPEVRGTVAVEELAFRPRDFEQGFFGGTLRLAFAGHRLRIDSLALLTGDRDKPGRFSVSGALSYQDRRFADLDLRLAARGVRLEREEVIDLTLQSADLSYTSQGEGYLLAGEVALGESRYYYELTPQQLLSALQSSAGPVQEPHPIQAGTRLDLRLDGGEQLWIESNLAEVRLQAALGVIGTLAEPRVNGRVTIEEGSVFYLDREFRVTTGTMDFIDPRRINPVIDFRAVAEVRNYHQLETVNYTISIKVEGRLEAPRFSLESQPPLSRPDIVALLTVGATSDQLLGAGSGSSSVGQIMSQRALSLGARGISQYLSNELSGLLTLDELQVEPGPTPGGGLGGGTRVTATERLFDRLEVTYSTTVGQVNERRVRLEYEISRYFSLEGRTDERGRSAGFIKYQTKFR